MGTKRSPDKAEIAKMVVLHEMGKSDRAIGEELERGHGTVKKYYLQSEVYTDPTIKDLIAQIRDREIEDLSLLGAKGRAKLHEMLDDGDKLQMIPVVAMVDRTFQQRRLLEGKSTANVNSLSSIIVAATEGSKKANDVTLPKVIDVTPEGQGEPGA